MNIAQTPKLGGGNALYSKHNLKPYTLCLLSILCIHFGIASYQPFIDTALILLCGGIIAIIIDNNGDLKTSLYKSRFIIVAVALGAVSYQVVNMLFKRIGIASFDSYNNQIVPLNDLANHILKAIEIGFKYLFAHDNESFMPITISLCFVLFVAILFTLLISTKISKKAKIIITMLFVAMVVASQTHIILSKTIDTSIYVEYYGLAFLRVVIVALVFKFCMQFTHTQNIIQNSLFVICVVFIWICVIADLNIQKIQKLATEKDLKFLNRVVSMIEQNEGFSYNRKYCGIIMGSFEPAIIKGFVWDTTFLRFHEEFFHLIQKDIFNNCGVMQSWKKDTRDTPEYNVIISRLHKAGILDKLQPFPHKNSVVVFEDIIVFVASKEDLDEIKQMAKDLP